MFIKTIKLQDLLMISDYSGESVRSIARPSGMSAIYAGPIAQEIFDQMQSDMDKIAQGDLFSKDDGDGLGLVPTDVERCMEWRMNYYIDMQGHADEFERFEENFSFKKPYTSEDPVDSFKGNPSAQAFEAFMKF